MGRLWFSRATRKYDAVTIWGGRKEGITLISRRWLETRVPIIMGLSLGLWLSIPDGLGRDRLPMATPLYDPTASVEGGPQLLFVFVGHSNCHWSNLADMPGAVESLKARVASLADSTGRSFKALGVATDYDIKAGTGVSM